MKVLLIGSGGVGEAIAVIAQKRDPDSRWLEKMVLADYGFPGGVMEMDSDYKLKMEQDHLERPLR